MVLNVILGNQRNVLVSVVLIALFTVINAQTPITDANFHAAINTCLSTNPIDGLCSTSEYGSIPDWDVSAVTDMSYAFSGTSFNGDITAWDVSNVTNMAGMFKNAGNFDQEIGVWDVSSVTDMSDMFNYAWEFNQNINSWDVSSVIDMRRMFFSAKVFNQPLDSWDVSSVVDMGSMFTRADFFNQPIGSWNTSSVTNMAIMFSSAWDFNQDISNWDVGNVTDMSGMFIRAYDFNQDIGNWDVSSVTDMSNMFSSTDGGMDFNQDISNWDVSNVTNMSGMFCVSPGSSKFNQDIGSWNVTGVTNMTEMFCNTLLSTLNYDSLLSGWASQMVQNGVPFDGGNATYCNSSSDRDILINSYGWMIDDGGLDCSTLSLTNLNKYTITIYPNPFQDTIELIGNRNPVRISVYDQSGRKILERLETSIIDLGSLPSGLYFLHLKNDKYHEVKKVIKY